MSEFNFEVVSSMSQKSFHLEPITVFESDSWKLRSVMSINICDSCKLLMGLGKGFKKILGGIFWHGGGLWGGGGLGGATIVFA